MNMPIRILPWFALERVRSQAMSNAVLCCLAFLLTTALSCQTVPSTIAGCSMQDSSKDVVDGEGISQTDLKPDGWYRATVPGTVLTTLVDNKVYPEPLYGENMRAIPESMNKASYWYRANLTVPASYNRRYTWLHFGGVNY